MTPKYTRLNCILASRSRLLGLAGFGLVIMMMMDVFFHAQALYSVYGKRAYGILIAYHENHDNDDGFDDDDTHLFSGLKGADSIVCSSIHGGECSAGHMEAIQVF